MLTHITIYEDGIFVGSGTMTEYGSIRDCAANLGDDVYEAIELAAAEGLSGTDVGGIAYTWHIILEA